MIEAGRRRLESGECLSDGDRSFFEIVTRVCAEFDGKVIVRAAGGWVRDMLLQKPSDDIDLAVEGVGWREFAEHLQNAYDPNRKIAVIEANPGMSKSISTARVCISKGNWVDVCDIQGDVQEDARRRDFTVNALFFNINERKIEDFVGGMVDLENRILRTPIDSVLTFKEDPLRVIRGLRFVCAYDFVMDDAIFEAAAQIRDAFEMTIARERITVELTKCAKSRLVYKLPDLLVRCGLFLSVFTGCGFGETVAAMRCKIALSRNEDIENGLSVMIAGVYFDGLMDKPNTRLNTMCDAIITKGLSMPKKIAVDARTIVFGAMSMRPLVDDTSRLSVGRWVRSVGKLWPLVRCVLDDVNLLQFFDQILRPFIDKENLSTAFELKPLMVGGDLCSAFNVKPGPMIAKMIEDLIHWQIVNPNGTADEYVRFARAKAA